MTRITDMHGDLQAESSGWLFKSPLGGGGGIIVAAPTTGRIACFENMWAIGALGVFLLGMLITKLINIVLQRDGYVLRRVGAKVSC